MQARIARWGNSLGLRLPRELAARLGIGEGTRVELSAEGSRIVIDVGRPVYRLEELLQDASAAELRTAFDWGEDVGRERVE